MAVADSFRKIVCGAVLGLLFTMAAASPAHAQFSNLNNCCYCNTVAFGLGKKAWGALVMASEQLNLARSYWAGGIAMASGTALVFVITINVLMKKPQAAA